MLLSSAASANRYACVIVSEVGVVRLSLRCQLEKFARIAYRIFFKRKGER